MSIFDRCSLISCSQLCDTLHASSFLSVPSSIQVHLCLSWRERVSLICANGPSLCPSSLPREQDNSPRCSPFYPSLARSLLFPPSVPSMSFYCCSFSFFSRKCKIIKFHVSVVMSNLKSGLLLFYLLCYVAALM